MRQREGTPQNHAQGSIKLTLTGVKTVGANAFASCKALTTVSLPAATSIGGNAFRRCTALATVSLPAATNIGNYAFDGCAAVINLSLTAAGSITLEGSAFSDFNATTKCTLVLNPDKRYDAAGDATPKVSQDGSSWGTLGSSPIKWQSITYATDPAPAP